MATQRVLPQSKETLLQNYNKRLRDDIRSILDNFTEIIKTAKVSLGANCQCQELCDHDVLALVSQSHASSLPFSSTG